MNKTLAFGNTAIQTVKAIKERCIALQQMRSFLASRYLLIALSFFLPFAIAVAFAAMNGKNIFDIVPHYSGGDEVGRYQVVDGLLKYGKTLGCYGYNGSCAHIPQYGNAWGIAWTFPYVVFGAVFGWEFNSPIIANLFFCGVANVIFILLTGCGRRDIAFLILANCVLFIHIHYSMTAMAESSRYAMAVILSGMFYRLMFQNTSKLYCYAIVPLMCIFASFMYLILSCFFGLYLLLMASRAKGYTLLNGLAAFVLFLIAVCAMLYVNALFTPQYYEESALSKLMAGEGGMITIIHALFGGLRRIDIYDIVINKKNHMYLWFVVLCYGLAICLAILLYGGRLEVHDKKVVYLSAFLIAVFIGGHCALYTHASDVSFVRGCMTSICATAYLSVLMYDKKLFLVFVTVSLTYAAHFPSDINSMLKASYKVLAPDERKTIVATVKRTEHLVCDASAADPWDNTAAMFMPIGPEFLFLPSCLSTNLVTVRKGVDPLPLARRSRYAFIGRGYGRDALIKRFLGDGYTVVDKSELYVLLKKM